MPMMDAVEHQPHLLQVNNVPHWGQGASARERPKYLFRRRHSVRLKEWPHFGQENLVNIFILFVAERHGSGDPTPCGGYPAPDCSHFSFIFFSSASTRRKRDSNNRDMFNPTIPISIIATESWSVELILARWFTNICRAPNSIRPMESHLSPCMAVVVCFVIYFSCERHGSGDPTPCGGYPGPACSTIISP